MEDDIIIMILIVSHEKILLYENIEDISQLTDFTRKKLTEKLTAPKRET
jgi:hypothetical protein